MSDTPRVLARAVVLGSVIALSAPVVAQAWQRLPDARADAKAYALSLAARQDGALAVATESGQTSVRMLRRGGAAWLPAQRYPGLTSHVLLGGATFTLLGEAPTIELLFTRIMAAFERSDGRGLRSARRLDPRPGWRAEGSSLRTATNLDGRGIVTWYASRGSTPERAISTLQRRRNGRGRLTPERPLDIPCAATVNDRGDVLFVGESLNSEKGPFVQTWYADGRRSRRSYPPIPVCPWYEEGQIALALADNGAAVITWTSWTYNDGVTSDAYPEPVEAVARRRWGGFGRVRTLGGGTTDANRAALDEEHPAVSAALDARGRGLIAWRDGPQPALSVAGVRGGRIGTPRALSPGPLPAELVGTASHAGRVAVAWGPIEPSDTEFDDSPGELRVSMGRAGSSQLSTERVVDFRPVEYMADATLLVSRRPARLHLGWLTSDDKASTIGVARRRLP